MISSISPLPVASVAERISERAAVMSAASPQTTEATQEAALIRELAATDRAVRAHEAAHMAAAGGLAQGGANFTTVRGPDGRMYAVGGEVSIDVSPGRTPEETLSRAQAIRRAALAPADPSAQDYRVAAQAAQMAAQAQRELATQSAEGEPGGARRVQVAAAYSGSLHREPDINLFA
jgi:hypothetical protein